MAASALRVIATLALALVASTVSMHANAQQPMVVGGGPAKAGEFGFVASILDARQYRKSGAYQAQFCAASLTSPTTLITAAHCLVDQQTKQRLNSEDLLVAFGSDLRSPELRVIGVDDFRVHPGYRVKTTENDLAVVYLSQPVDDFPTIAPPQGADVAAYDAAGTAAKVAGWGNTRAHGNRYPTELHVANVRVFPNASCGRGKSYEINGVEFDGFTKREADPLTMLCAAGANPAGDVIDACQGDSGGPLVAGVGDAARLIGVVSWGQRCATLLPGVYTRVSSESDFLVEAGAIPRTAPILAPTIVTSQPSANRLRVKVTAPVDGTPIDAFAVTAVDTQTGAVFTCASQPRPPKRTGACVVEGIPAGSVLRVEAISGNGAGSSPVSEPSFVTF